MITRLLTYALVGVLALTGCANANTSNVSSETSVIETAQVYDNAEIIKTGDKTYSKMAVTEGAIEIETWYHDYVLSGIEDGDFDFAVIMYETLNSTPETSTVRGVYGDETGHYEDVVMMVNQDLTIEFNKGDTTIDAENNNSDSEENAEENNTETSNNTSSVNSDGTTNSVDTNYSGYSNTETTSGSASNNGGGTTYQPTCRTIMTNGSGHLETEQIWVVDVPSSSSWQKVVDYYHDVCNVCGAEIDINDFSYDHWADVHDGYGGYYNEPVYKDVLMETQERGHWETREYWIQDIKPETKEVCE